MIPGRISRVVEGGIVASAASITLRDGEVFRITGSTQINNIFTSLGNQQNQVIYLIPVDGAVILGASGNILVGLTMAQNRVLQLMWLKSTQKWYLENGV